MNRFQFECNSMVDFLGLSAVLAFAENYAMAGRYVEGVISGIVGKCLTSPKVKTRELSYEIVLMYVEIEKQDLVIEELLKGLDNKTPKIVAASVSLIKQCINNYGVKVINIKPVVKVCLNGTFIFLSHLSYSIFRLYHGFWRTGIKMFEKRENSCRLNCTDGSKTL